MQIKIISVNNQKVKTYFQLDVVYESQWGNKTFKLFSFANPATYAVLKDAQPGEQYDITTGKNDKDYTTWTSATKIATSAATVPQGSAATKSTWVPDADRQRLIVKQSSLGHAVEALGSGKSPEEYIDVAEKFVQYVFDVPELETTGE